MRSICQTSRFIPSGFHMALVDWRLVKMTESRWQSTWAVWKNCFLEINFFRTTTKELYMLIFFTFIYWLVCWVTYLFIGSEVFFFVSCLHFLSPFCFLSTCFNNTTRFVFFVVIPVSIVTLIYVDLRSKSKFYWILWLNINKSVNYNFSNTYCFLFTFPWHF